MKNGFKRGFILQAQNKKAVWDGSETCPSTALSNKKYKTFGEFNAFRLPDVSV
jgi:hypothetical protein